MADVEEIVKYMKTGGLIILVDDEDRENEGDLVGIGAKMSPENVNFMVTHARGLLCTPVGENITRRLGLTQMVANNTESNGTRFTFRLMLRQYMALQQECQRLIVQQLSEFWQIHQAQRKILFTLDIHSLSKHLMVGLQFGMVILRLQ